jgi:5-(carboxyamino)imidazole ribonucleotide synthase
VPRVGIIGAGQLGMMLGEAATALDLECVFLDPASDPPAAGRGDIIRAQFDDARALARLAGDVDVITYEFENVPVDSLEPLATHSAVYPPVNALRQAQDRLLEKQQFADLGIPLPMWRQVDSEADLQAAARDLGFPLVVKTRRFGYDGKGQYIVKRAADIADALRTLPNKPLIAEQWIAFDREVSAIGVRSRDGTEAFYPLTANQHRNGILRRSSAPAGPAALQELANGYLSTLLRHLEYVGVLALEFFVVGEQLLANEYAPRVHNSGHWTIEGATTSQFENHLRAVCGMPLGPTDVCGHAGMLNLIGAMPNSLEALRDAGVVVHDYGKTPRSGRKLGHLTLVDDDAASRDQRLQKLEMMLGG